MRVPDGAETTINSGDKGEDRPNPIVPHLLMGIDLTELNLFTIAAHNDFDRNPKIALPESYSDRPIDLNPKNRLKGLR